VKRQVNLQKTTKTQAIPIETTSAARLHLHSRNYTSNFFVWVSTRMVYVMRAKHRKLLHIFY